MATTIGVRIQKFELIIAMIMALEELHDDSGLMSTINTKLFTKFILRVKDQKDGNRDVKIEDNHMYSPDNYSSGRVEFLSLAKLQDPKMGFLVDDTVIIEAEVTLLGLVMKE
ncbi:hypothetical protein JRO89_XS01G0402100 [Xanthoceras sorbifolium]|uniref:MATH domain-containing protein n=1 Tax=Xanthoceras sorbifolium TaxID=99658 RepID=A0ABQ8IQ33_9ROSI|nr:hypothetical protein JRO89_XS01G0402100 [Xanthoceras sorbifolium]